MNANQLMEHMENLGYYTMKSCPIDHHVRIHGHRNATLPGFGTLMVIPMRSGGTNESRWKVVTHRRAGLYVHIYTDDTIGEIVAKIEGQEKLL